MPSFLKDLRRKSRPNIQAGQPSAVPNPNPASLSASASTSAASSADTTDSAQSGSRNRAGNSSSKDRLFRSKSSSTLSSLLTSVAPASSTAMERDRVAADASPTKDGRPQIAPTKRYSIGTNLTSSGLPTQSTAPLSPKAPQVLSISENTWVHQKVLLIYGQAGDPSQKPANGTLTVGHHNDTFPAVSWPVCKSQFKALVHLQPGPNRLRLEFSTGKANAHQYLSQFRINYLPLTASPPLHLAILVAKDSPTTFDSSPERTRVEGNGLDTAVRKFRMAACLWQAFTGEQMNRNGFGRRCFRLEEEWQANTLTCRESTSLQMRNEVKIHLIRTNKTLQQIRDPDVAQQNSSASRKGDLFTYAMEAVKSHFAVVPGQPRYVSCLWLDSHWDPKAGTILGHAALGGGNADFRLAVFGSHALHSYPSCLEEVVPAFSDRTPTDTSILANDNNECGSSCETANVGIGAQLHELGHLFGSPHQTSGVMRRDYLTISHTFLVQLPPRKGTGATETRLCLQEDECSWHRLDCLRFRHHPCFRLPDDPPRIHDEDVQVWPVENSGVLATSTAGLAFVELFTGDDVLCRSYIEYGDGHAASYPRQVFVTEPELRNRLPESHRAAGILRVAFHSVGLSTSVVEDFALLASKVSRIRLSNGQAAFRGTKLGLSALLDSKAEELLLSSTTTSPPKLLVTIRVYHGLYVDGIEFVYEDATSQIFGKKGGKSGGSEFALDTRRGETLLGFHVRTGAWIDALQILTSLGRRSEVFGSSAGGSSHTLLPPRGYTIAGIHGSCAKWLDGFGLIITR